MMMEKMILLRKWKNAEEDPWKHQQQVGSCDEEREIHSWLQDCAQDSQEFQRFHFYVFWVTIIDVLFEKFIWMN